MTLEKHDLHHGDRACLIHLRPLRPTSGAHQSYTAVNTGLLAINSTDELGQTTRVTHQGTKSARADQFLTLRHPAHQPTEV